MNFEVMVTVTEIRRIYEAAIKSAYNPNILFNSNCR